MLDDIVERNIIYYSSVENDRFVKRYSLLRNLGVKSVVILPLRIRDRKIGIILLGDKRQKYHNKLMLDFYNMMANRLALVVNNVILFTDVVLEKNRITSIIQSMNEGVVSVDWERKIVDFNKAAEEITGWKEDEVIGKNCHTIFTCQKSPSGRDCADVCPLLEILTLNGNSNKGIRTEGKFFTKDGKERDLSVTTSLLSQGEDPVGGVLVFRDITEEKKFQSRRSDYLAAISHDMFTPLTAIKGYSTTLLMHQDRFDAKTQQNFIKVINSEIDRVTRLLYNLMSLSRMESDRLQSLPQVCNLNSIVERIVNLYSLSTRNHNLIMDPSVSKDLQIFADCDQIEQILNNLVSNAVKYSPAGGDVIISAKKVDDNFIEVSVKDNGIGIDTKDLDRIFEKYRRVIKESSKSVSGMGLGLFITKVLVELQGGKIWAENCPEGGSRFIFTIPSFKNEIIEDEEQE
jgi:PAS domain S-box-containing protein